MQIIKLLFINLASGSRADGRLFPSLRKYLPVSSNLMTDVNSPKKHHYIPEVYLKYFANKQKQLWRRDKNKIKCSICTPAQVGYEKDGNKLRTKEMFELSELTDVYHIEKTAFKRQENNYPKVLSKINQYSTEPLVIGSSEYFLYLKPLVTIKRRNPTTRMHLTETYLNAYNSEDAIPQFKKYLIEEAAKENVVLEDGVENRIRDYIESRVSNPDWMYDMYLSAFLNPIEYKVIDDITSQLFGLKKFILHAPYNSQFITSDNPGFTKFKDTIVSTGGFGGDFEFYFPLTPTTCLLISSQIMDPAIGDEKWLYPVMVNSNDVSEINQSTKAIANQKLFGYDKTKLEII